MQETEREELARLMKALGHPVRVQIIEILAAEGSCLTGDLSSRVPVAASTTSQHLSQLKEAGLISGTIDGPRRCYCVKPEALEKIHRLLGRLPTCCPA